MTRTRRLLRLAALATLALIAPGCEKPEQQSPPPPFVSVASPVSREVEVFSAYTGVMAAAESVEIRARVPGYLESIEFLDSADVRQGDLLFVIEDDVYEAARDAALAELSSAEAEFARAQREFNRVEKAALSDAVSKLEVSTRRADRDKAAAAVLAAKARLANAELELQYTEVRSPIRGRVGRHLVDVGNLVGAGESTLLTTVVKMDPIYVYFDVEERVLVRFLRETSGEDRQLALRRARVALAVGDETEYTHEGFLDFVDNVVDSDTGTARVRAKLENPSGILYPGLFARVRVIDEQRQQVLLVEERAIGTDLAGKYLLIVGDNDVVERRHVETGAQYDSMRAVVGELDTGDRYVVNGLQKARPGLPVTVQEAMPDGPAGG